MSTPLVPFRFDNAANLDVDSLNDNLVAIKRDIDRDMGARYTYSTARFDLEGVVFSDASALRSFEIPRSGTDNAAEIIGCELTIYSATANAWEVTVSNIAEPLIELTTTAGVTEESYASSDRSFPITSSVVPPVITVGASAGTIAAGELVVHVRSDRGQQTADSSDYAPFIPTLFDASSDHEAADLDAVFVEVEDAVQRSIDADNDARVEIYTARNLVPGAAGDLTFTIPAGDPAVARQPKRIDAYAVCAAGTTARVTLAYSAGTTTVDVAGSGVTVQARAGADLAAATNDDPMNPSDDFILHLKHQSGAANVLLLYAVIWWQ